MPREQGPGIQRVSAGGQRASALLCGPATGSVEKCHPHTQTGKGVRCQPAKPVVICTHLCFRTSLGPHPLSPQREDTLQEGSYRARWAQVWCGLEKAVGGAVQPRPWQQSRKGHPEMGHRLWKSPVSHQEESWGVSSGSG